MIKKLRNQSYAPKCEQEEEGRKGADTMKITVLGDVTSCIAGEQKKRQKAPINEDEPAKKRPHIELLQNDVCLTNLYQESLTVV
jgi:hypothetical protein